MGGASGSVAAVIGCALLAAGCGAGSPRFTSRERPAPVAPGAAPPAASQMAGVASYYADEFNGRQTASGEVYNMDEMTAAHRTLPFGTKVRVTSIDTGRSVVVRINDRGPFKDDRVIDLSLGAAKQLGLIAAGTGRVVLQILEAGAR